MVMTAATRLALACLLMVCLQGCLARHSAPAQDPWADVALVTESSPTGGSIYSDAQGYTLFGDLKARNVGDILTVLLVERTDAIKSSSTNTSKETNVSAANPTLFGRPVTHNGVPLLTAEVGATTSFSGDGSSSQSNRLSGSVTVTVVHRYPNGNLRVRGRKRIALNQGSEFVAVSGVVRPQDIDTTNTVRSDRIADSEISYSAKGPLADANKMGILARFFNSPWSIFRWPGSG